jgi:heme-degrading monooxygenase HmoA
VILQRVEMAVRSGLEHAFEGALLEVRQRVFMSAGFRGFDVHQGLELPAGYLVLVRWETAEELAAFAESRFERAWEPVRPFLAGPMRTDHFTERESLGMTGPGVVTDLDWASRPPT